MIGGLSAVAGMATMPQGVGSAYSSILQFVTPDALTAMERNAALVAEQQAQPLITGLASHLSGCLQRAKTAKQPIEQQMLKSLRQRNNQYEPDKLAEIRKFGGSEIYVGITDTKCQAAEAWIRDVLLPADDKPWGIAPSPVPDMPVEEIQAQVQRVVMVEVQQAYLDANRTGQPLEITPEAIRDRAVEVEQGIRARIAQEAREAAEREEKAIDDALREGGFYEAIATGVSHAVTLNGMVLKGPTIRKRKALAWERGADGKFAAQVTEKFVTEWSSPSPFDIYPAPGISDVSDGFMFERHKLTRSDLVAMRGVDGYDQQAIDTILMRHGQSGYTESLGIDTMRAQIERGAGTSTIWAQSDEIEAWEFWGEVSGRMLLDWDGDKGILAGEGIDPMDEYQITAWMCAGVVFRCLLNPDPLGKKPYSIAGFRRRPGSFWFTGLPESMESSQGMANAAARALSNNMGLSSGPQVAVDLAQLPDGVTVTNLYPWKLWQYDSSKNPQSRDFIQFFQPNSHARELMDTLQYWVRRADEDSAIPAYMYGGDDARGAGGTASGLSMLMDHASKGLKDVIRSIDAAIQAAITRQHTYHMMFSPGEFSKGDTQIIARGSSALIVKAQAQARRLEYMNMTANPIDMQIIGIEGRAEMHRQVVSTLDLPPTIIPDKQELRARLQADEAARQQAAQAANPRQLGMDGNPQGGVDARVMDGVAR